MKTIKRIDTKSTVKVYAYFGLLLGIIIAVVNGIAGSYGLVEVPQGVNVFSLGLITILMYVITLAVGAWLFVIFYNCLAKKGKGIKIELK